MPSGEGCGTMKQGALWSHEGRAPPACRGKCYIYNTLNPSLEKSNLQRPENVRVTP